MEICEVIVIHFAFPLTIVAHSTEYIFIKSILVYSAESRTVTN